jgi:hypothetical protein
MYLAAILVAHFEISFGSLIISAIPSNITKENGGVWSSTQRLTFGLLRIVFAFIDSYQVVNITS